MQVHTVLRSCLLNMAKKNAQGKDSASHLQLTDCVQASQGRSILEPRRQLTWALSHKGIYENFHPPHRAHHLHPPPLDPRQPDLGFTGS